jgi:hypothetical protein
MAKRKGQKDKHKTWYKSKDRVTRTLLRTGDELYDSLARTHLIPEVKTIINNTNSFKSECFGNVKSSPVALSHYQ